MLVVDINQTVGNESMEKDKQRYKRVAILTAEGGALGLLLGRISARRRYPEPPDPNHSTYAMQLERTQRQRRWHIAAFAFWWTGIGLCYGVIRESVEMWRSILNERQRWREVIREGPKREPTVSSALIAGALVGSGVGMLRGLGSLAPSRSLRTAWLRAVRGTTAGVILALTHYLVTVRVLPILFSSHHTPSSSSPTSSPSSSVSVSASSSSPSRSSVLVEFLHSHSTLKRTLDWLGIHILTRDEYERRVRQQLEEVTREERYRELLSKVRRDSSTEAKTLTLNSLTSPTTSSPVSSSSSKS